MSSFDHDPRGVVMLPTQHLLKHPSGGLVYTNPSLPSVASIGGALDWLIQTIYPYPQDAVATPGDLPASGNTINDYRVVTDDGDGKAAGYQWQQREGDVAAKWYKIYDMDWGYDQILSGFLNRTLDFYVYKHGYDDLDSTGTPLAGDDAGQHIFGGDSANTHLTLHANSGDGVGAQTGYIQAADHVRPQVDGTWDLGTSSEKWRKIWADDAKIGTLTIDGNTITADGGTIDFVNDVITMNEGIFGGNIRINAGSVTNPGVHSPRQVAHISTTNSDWLYSTSTDFNFDGSSDFTLACWVNLQDKSASSLLLARWNAAAGGRHYALMYNNGADVFRFIGDKDGASPPQEITLDATTFGSPSVDTWYFVVARFQAGVNVDISVNAGTPDTFVYTDVLYAAGGTKFSIGGQEDASPLAEAYVANAGAWARRLSDAELVTVYNSGGGLEYQGLTVGLKTDLISYWELSETSDGSGAVTRADSHGSNDLTDINTTDSVLWDRYIGGGTISFDDDDLSTSGTLTVGAITSTGVSSFGSGTTIGTLTLADGSITDSSGTIDFGNETLTTTGVINGGQVNADNIRLDGNTISITDTDGNLILSANGTGTVNVTSGLVTAAITTTGVVGVTGQLNVDNLRLDGNTLSATGGGNLIIAPDGASSIVLSTAVRPDADDSVDFGANSTRFRDLYLSGAIKDGTNTFSIANIMTFAAVGSPNANDSLFWDGAKWVASNPDSEIAHSELDGITTGDAGHTQFVVLNGRSGGQLIKGGTGAAENLTLQATHHATPGEIVLANNTRPIGDGSLDFGGSSNSWNDIYVKGQLKGARAENFTTAGRPAASAGTAGRFIWDTDLLDLMVDIGGTWIKMSLDKWQFEDASTWNGSTTTVTYTVDGSVSPERGRVTDARKCIWMLKDNTNSHKNITDAVTIDHPASNQVRITVGAALPSGTYRLIGIG